MPNPTAKQLLAEADRLRANRDNLLSQSLAIQRDLDACERDLFATEQAMARMAQDLGLSAPARKRPGRLTQALYGRSYD
jgi:hypothetical protein